MAKTLHAKSKDHKLEGNICKHMKDKNLISLIYKELLKIDEKETKKHYRKICKCLWIKNSHKN